MSKLLSFLSTVWSLAKPYFTSERKWRARSYLLGVIALNLISVYALVLINDWNRLFYDALQNKDARIFWEQLGRFGYLAFGYMIVMVYKFYLTQRLQMDWREWMTQSLLNKWLGNNNFYRMEVRHLTKSDNPDQRIAEDIQQFTSLTTNLLMGLLHSTVTLASFVTILWTLSGVMEVWGVNIPGFMVWVAVLYCAVGSVISHWIGKPLNQLNWNQQKAEADFRHHLIRVREHSDAISLDKAGSHEQTGLYRHFNVVMTNWLSLVLAQKRLTWFTSGFNQAAVVFPFIVAAPRFFSGAIQLGQLMQIASAFGRVQDALSWFVDNYSRLAEWSACVKRLQQFNEQMKESTSSDIEGNYWQGHNIQVCTPGDAVMHQPINFNLEKGHTLWVRGLSGIGKSSLMRVLCGTWEWFHGSMVPAQGKLLSVVQTPYIPNGTLHGALSYPSNTLMPRERCVEALRKVALEHLIDSLDTDDTWQLRLSGGERQRMALARVWVHQPEWIFMDEPTSALDASTEEAVLTALHEYQQSSNCGIFVISHRDIQHKLANISVIHVEK